jgi:deoxyguanosine kinase
MRDLIVIEGLIGAGKTSLAKMVAKESAVSLALEPFESNPFLEPFFMQGQKGWQLETRFLIDRAMQLQGLLNANSVRPILTDYHPAKSLLFARLHLADNEYRHLSRMYASLFSQIPEPNHIFYLDTEIEVLEKNIESRGRLFESGITTSFLETLQSYYKEELVKWGDNATSITVQNPTDKLFKEITQQIADFIRKGGN